MESDIIPTTLFLACMIGGGVAALVYAACVWSKRVRMAGKVHEWDRVEGRIVSAEVVARLNDAGHDYEPLVRYAYTARGRRRTGNSLRVGAGQLLFGKRADAVAAIARYRAGEQVRVYVDPLDPAHSVLEPRASRARLRVWISLGIALLGTGVYMAFAL